jgi:integrase
LGALPAQRIALGQRRSAIPGSEDRRWRSGQFENLGLDRRHWKSAAAVRKIFRQEFERAGLPYFNPHSFRKTPALLGLKTCPNFEALKAWSQNLGHTQMLTTLNSYGIVQPERQAEIFERLRADLNQPDEGLDADTVQKVMAMLSKKHATG